MTVIAMICCDSCGNKVNARDRCLEYADVLVVAIANIGNQVVEHHCLADAEMSDMVR